MNVKLALDQFYLDMITYELRMMNENSPGGNITYNSMLYLDLIAGTPQCTVSHLAELLHVAKSAVTLKVKELEKLGTVHKTQSETDKRVFYLSVNDEIAHQYQSFDAPINEAVAELKKQYTETEINQFCDMLTFFSKRYSKA